VIRNKIFYPFLIFLAFLPIVNLLNTPVDTMLLIVTIFIVVYLLRAHLTLPFIQNFSKRYLLIVLCIIASGLIAEVLAWTSEYLAKSVSPALLHPQLFPDLIMGIGFYGSWALVWTVILNKYKFHLKEVFILQGLYGVLIEQQVRFLCKA
jgi:hypothetical protein